MRISIACVAVMMCVVGFAGEVAAIEDNSSVPALTISQIEIFRIPKELEGKRGSLTQEEFRLAQELVEMGGRLDEKLYDHIIAVSNSPSSFPPDEIEKSLDSLLKLTVNMKRLDQIEMWRGPDRLLNTWWRVFGEGVDTQDVSIHAALANIARRSANVPGCELADLQLDVIPAIFWYEYSMAKILSPERRSCNAMPYSWLMANDHWQQVPAQIGELKKFVGNVDYSFMHRELVSQFMNNCSQPELASFAKALGVCAWKSNPMELGALRRLPVKNAYRFEYTPVKITNGDTTQVEIESMVNKIASSRVNGSARDTLVKLEQYGDLSLIGYWTNKAKNMVVFYIEAHLSNIPDYQNNYSQQNEQKLDYITPSNMEGKIIFLVSITKNMSRYMTISESFGQYDDGTIAAITDIDRDGNIEVWFSAEWGECDGEGLVPGKDCSITHYFMGEQFGRYLGYFVQGAHP